MEPWRYPESTDAHERRRLYGVFPGIVTNNKDPENRGRVKVRFPWLSESEESWWARVATFYAGKGRGSYLMPEVDDEVLVAFEHGDFHFPYVVGSVWNGVDNVPGPGNPDGENNIKHFESRCGHKLIFDDTAGAEKITLVDSSGNNSVVIDVAADTITSTAQTGHIYIKAPSGKINVKCKDLNVTASLNASYDIGNDHQVSCKTQEMTVGAAQVFKVDTKMEQDTPLMQAQISGVFTLLSSTAKVEMQTVDAQIGSAVLTEGTVTMDVKQRVAELGAYTLTTTSAKTSAGKLGISAGALMSVASAKISADGSTSCVVAGKANTSVLAGMVVFKGSSVMVHGSV